MRRSRSATTAMLLGILGLAGLPAAAGDAQDDSVFLFTHFSIFVGFPADDEPRTGGELLVPGTLIPLDLDSEVPPGSSNRNDVVKRSLDLTRAVDKLWTTFRLDSARKIQKSQMIGAIPGERMDLPQIPGSDVRIQATLLRISDTTGTYRVVFSQGERSLADSTVTVNRGGRAVVGGMDGASAPYIFVLIEPAEQVPEAAGVVRYRKDTGITEPAKRLAVRPAYPEEARQQKITGIVVLDVLIDTEGAVHDVVVLSNPSQLLTDAAVEAVRQWRFDPARRCDGTPVTVRYVLTVQYSLK